MATVRGTISQNSEENEGLKTVQGANRTEVSPCTEEQTVLQPPAFVPDKTANPCITGLFGFALTTMCMGLATTENLGIDETPSLAMAFIFGGGCQFVTGAIALCKGWVYDGTVAICFGCSWISTFIMLVVLPEFDRPPRENDLLIFFFVWTMITFSFTLTARKHGLGNLIVFLLLLLTYIMLDIKYILALHDRFSPRFNQATGWVEFLCGFSAWATATAALVNKECGKVIIPL